MLNFQHVHPGKELDTSRASVRWRVGWLEAACENMMGAAVRIDADSLLVELKALLAEVEAATFEQWRDEAEDDDNDETRRRFDAVKRKSMAEATRVIELCEAFQACARICWAQGIRLRQGGGE